MTTTVEMLKRTIADEVKEKYSLYKRIKELNEENENLKTQLNRNNFRDGKKIRS